MAKNEDKLGLKLGSEDMIFWRNLIDAKRLDLKTTQDNLKFYEFLLECAEKKYAEAEKEFNKKI